MTSEPIRETKKGQEDDTTLSYSPAIEANSINPDTYYMKGLNAHSLKRNEEAISWFDRAIQIDPNDANFYCSKGLALQDLEKTEEALLCFDKAIEINPKSGGYLSKKGLALQKLGRNQEAVEFYDKAIEIEPDKTVYYYNKGVALKSMGKNQEAKACFDKLGEIRRSKENFHIDEGNALKSQRKYQEAAVAFDKAIGMNKNNAESHFNKGIVLINLRKHPEAILCFDKAIEINVENPLYYCVRGRTLRFLGKQQDAFIDFKKAQEILKNGKVIVGWPITRVEYLGKMLHSIFELQKEDDMAERILENFDKNNLNLLKFVEDLRVFQFTKEKVTTEMLAPIEKKDVELNQENIQTALQLKEYYTGLQHEMKEELAKELDELDGFYKKFNIQVRELDLLPDDQIRVKDYFEAFIGTFSSVFDASQAIKSEQLHLDVECLLSAFASLASFVDENFLKEITSIEKFLLTKEMKRNAKKMLTLLYDSIYLNVVIGKTAEKIVLSQKKRRQILSIKERELDHQNRNLLTRISNFCEQMGGNIKIDSYRRLYDTPAARLGHMDANDLIREYLEGEIDPDRVQEEFIEKTLKRHRVTSHIEVIIPITATTPALNRMISKEEENGKGKCCSIF